MNLHKKNAIAILLAAIVFTIGCGKEQKQELDKLRAEKAEIEDRLKVGQESAHQAFLQQLGTWYPSVNGVLMPIPVKVNSTHFFDFLMLFIIPSSTGGHVSLNYKDFNKVLKHMLYEDGDRTKTQNANGALAVFLYASDLVEELFKDAEPPDNQKHVGLARLILACKETLAQLVENAASYESAKVDEVLADYEAKLKTVPELEIVSMSVGGGTGGTMDKIQEKSGGTPKNYLQEPGVQAAWKAFKEKVKEAQDKYEVVMGLKSPTIDS